MVCSRLRMADGRVAPTPRTLSLCEQLLAGDLDAEDFDSADGCVDTAACRHRPRCRRCRRRRRRRHYRRRGGRAPSAPKRRRCSRAARPPVSSACRTAQRMPCAPAGTSASVAPVAAESATRAPCVERRSRDRCSGSTCRSPTLDYMDSEQCSAAALP